MSYTPEVALDLILYSLEKGYSARQVVNGIIANRLLSNGALMGEQPEWEPFGGPVSSSAHLMDAYEHTAVLLEIGSLANSMVQKNPKLKSVERNILGALMLIDLENHGYSNEQIITALLCENITPVMGGFGCEGFCLEDTESRTLITPKYGRQTEMCASISQPSTSIIPNRTLIKEHFGMNT